MTYADKRKLAAEKAAKLAGDNSLGNGDHRRGNTGPLTKSLFWSKLISTQGTIFDSSASLNNEEEDMLLLSTDALAELDVIFAKHQKRRALTEAERIGQSVGAIGGVLKKGSLTFLDQRRFNNIAIKLTQIRMTNEDIKQAVLSVDFSILTPEKTKKLLLCAPNGDDLESIRPYDGDPDLLAQVERFFYDVQHVSCFESRLRAIDAYHRLNSLSDDAMRELETITHACTNILTSTHLSSLLRSVLAVGNKLNHGTSRGNYEGYRLDILPKLAFVKSTNPTGIDLMRWLAQQAFSSSHGGQDLVVSLSLALHSIRKGGTVNWEKMESTIRKIEKVPDLISRSIISVRKANSEPGATLYDVDSYELKMGNLIQHINRLLTTLRHRVAMSKHLYHKCAVFMGAPNDLPESLFSTISKFVSSFLEAHEKNVQAASRAARKARIEELSKADARERKMLKLRRMRKKSMYPQVFRMLRFKRGSCPQRRVNNKLHSIRRSGGVTGKKVSQEGKHQSGFNSHADGIMNELERMMEKRRLRRLQRGNRLQMQLGNSEAGRGQDGESEKLDVAFDRVLTRKSRRSRRLFKYHPSEKLSKLRVFGNQDDFGVALECENAWHYLEDEGPEYGSITWCLFKFVRNENTDNNQNFNSSVKWKLVLCGMGSGGLHGMNSFLKGDDGSALKIHCNSVLVGGFRVDAVDERENVISKRCKIVKVTFFGESSKAKLRSHAGMHRGHIAEVCAGFHVTMHIAGLKALLEEEDVKAQLLSATGSHKPTCFDFFSNV